MPGSWALHFQKGGVKKMVSWKCQWLSLYSGQKAHAVNSSLCWQGWQVPSLDIFLPVKLSLGADSADVRRLERYVRHFLPSPVGLRVVTLPANNGLRERVRYFWVQHCSWSTRNISTSMKRPPQIHSWTLNPELQWNVSQRTQRRCASDVFGRAPSSIFFKIKNASFD